MHSSSRCVAYLQALLRIPLDLLLVFLVSGARLLLLLLLRLESVFGGFSAHEPTNAWRLFTR